MKNYEQFNTINQESAYWIGFILADGCIYVANKKTGVYKVLKMSSKDYDHLEKFRTFMGTTDKRITTRSHINKEGNTHLTYSLDYSSNSLGESLGKWEIHPRKSLTTTVHPDLAQNVHFWRGVFDGDGSVMKRDRTFKKGVTSSLVFCMLGTPEVIASFREFADKYNINGTGAIENKYGLHYLRYGSLDSQTLLNVLYSEGGTHLTRKYEKYLDILNERESQDLLTIRPGIMS